MTAPQDEILDLLAAYALDALEPEEITRLHRLLAERPELRDTIAELRATANQLPYGLPEAEPPAELRQRVLDYATGRAERKPAAPARHPRRGWLIGLGGLAAAAVVAAAIGWGQVAGLRGELTQARAELVRSREDLATAQAVIARLEGATGQGAMVRTTEGGTVFVVKLPRLQPSRTYQLWRIEGENKPKGAGLFTVDQQGYGVFDLASGQQLQPGDTVAVTDEPAGGSPQPTNQVLIAGQIQT
jgi:anti-sigma-K factor RskA